MKLRIGFVSNSSSCSFCLAKTYMTEEQVKKFSEWLGEVQEWDRYEKDMEKLDKGEINDDDFFDMEEGGIEENEYYFMGTTSQHNEYSIGKKLKSLGVDKKYVMWGDG